jgi:VWFA-related protein
VGLSQGDFEIFDNGVRQKVDRVISESIPVDVALVLDVSGSLTGQPLVQLKEAALAFLTALAPGDRAALVTFSQEVVVPQSLTADLSAVRKAVTEMRAAGTTALYDATYVALHLRIPDQTRGVAVVLTDGADNASWLTADRVGQATEHSDVVVYGIAAHEAVPTARIPEAMSTPRTLGMARGGAAVLEAAAPPPISGLPQYRFLERLAATSGGRLFDASFAALHETFAGVLKDIRARYLLTYYPSNPTPGWHALEVKLTRGRANVTARRGYWVEAAPGQRSRESP